MSGDTPRTPDVLRFPTERVKPTLVRCRFPGCHRGFKTERGTRQHERRCWFDFDRSGNPYIPILDGKGRPVGICLNRPESVASYRMANDVLGLGGHIASIQNVQDR